MALYKTTSVVSPVEPQLLEDFPITTFREYFSYSLSTASCAAAFPTEHTCVLASPGAVRGLMTSFEKNKLLEPRYKIWEGRCWFKFNSK